MPGIQYVAPLGSSTCILVRLPRLSSDIGDGVKRGVYVFMAHAAWAKTEK